MEIVRDRFAFLIPGNAREKFLIKPGLTHLQQGRKCMCHDGLLVADERRIGADGFHWNARCQQIATRIEDVATSRCLAEFALRVVLRQLRQLVVTQHLQIHQPVAEPGEGCADKHGQRQHPSKLQSFRHCKTGRPPVAIGSSTDGVTSGGQDDFIASEERQPAAQPTVAPKGCSRAAWLGAPAAAKPASGCAGARPRFNSRTRRSSISGERKSASFTLNFSLPSVICLKRSSLWRICWLKR